MQEIEFKTVLLGDSSNRLFSWRILDVGKSSIMRRFVENVFDEQSRATVGTAYMTKKIEANGRHVNFQVQEILLYVDLGYSRPGNFQIIIENLLQGLQRSCAGLRYHQKGIIQRYQNLVWWIGK